MDLDAVIAKVDEILIRDFELGEDVVVPEASLRDDLDLDSLDGLDLVASLEREFSFQVDDDVLLELTTVGDIHAYVRKLHEHEAMGAPG